MVECGELNSSQDWGMGEQDGTEDVFPPWPEDLEAMHRQVCTSLLINSFLSILLSTNNSTNASVPSINTSLHI